MKVKVKNTATSDVKEAWSEVAAGAMFHLFY